MMCTTAMLSGIRRVTLASLVFGGIHVLSVSMVAAQAPFSPGDITAETDGVKQAITDRALAGVNVVDVTTKNAVDVTAVPLSDAAPTTLTWTVPASVVAKLYVVPKAGANFELCATMYSSSQSTSFRIVPSELLCQNGETFYKQAVVEMKFDAATAAVGAGSAQIILSMPNRKRPFYGSDFGFGLILLNRDKDHGPYKVEAGANAFYSLSKVKTKRTRLIANLALLDFDPAKDFEVGVGVGVAFRAFGWEKGKGDGFAFAAGYGWNMMVKAADHPGYVFVGLDYDINLESKK